jgi:hypothetical protein
MDIDLMRIIGAFILAAIAIFNWWQMSQAEELIEVVKFGFVYIGTIICMVNMRERG